MKMKNPVLKSYNKMRGEEQALVDRAVELSNEIFSMFRDANVTPDIAINTLISALVGVLRATCVDDLDNATEACIKSLRIRMREYDA
jgi:hypothetical protein